MPTKCIESGTMKINKGSELRNSAWRPFSQEALWSMWTSEIPELYFLCVCVRIFFLILHCSVVNLQAFLVAQMVKNLPAMQETWVWSPGQEDPLEKEMATHSSILAWRIPWTKGPSGLQSMGSQRAGHGLSNHYFHFHSKRNQEEWFRKCQVSCQTPYIVP